MKLKQKNIPDGWRKARLGSVASISSGGTPSRREPSYWNGDIPWVTTSEVDFNVITSTKETITDLGLRNSSAKVFAIDTLLMAMYGQGKTRGKISKLGIEAATNQACAAILVRENSVDYVFYYLTSQYKNIRRLSNDGGQKNLSASVVKAISILIPSISEQKRIVLVLEAWDEYLEKLERKIEIKKNIKKGLMQQLLTGGKRLKGFDESWRKVTLGDLGSSYAGLTGKNKDDFGFGKPFISYMNIYSNSKISLNFLEYVNLSEGEKQNRVRYGDLFFTTSSETPEEVGVSSVFLDKNCKELYLNSFCFGFRLHNFDSLLPEFAQFFFRGQGFRKSMFRIAQGASRFNLAKKYFSEVEIKIPIDIDEQAAIASILTKADKEIETLELKKRIVEDQKKYLLNNLITGKIRTPENMKVKV